MSIAGWYYLHTNGQLLYKRDLDGGTAADIRDSDFARSMWPIDPENRETAWAILIEALALDADKERVSELAEKWGCDNTDAPTYAKRVGVTIVRDGKQFCAQPPGFTNLNDSPAGFGDSMLEAMAELCKALGYTGGKMWNATFRSLLDARAKVPA